MHNAPPPKKKKKKIEKKKKKYNEKTHDRTRTQNHRFRYLPHYAHSLFRRRSRVTMRSKHACYYIRRRDKTTTQYLRIYIYINNCVPISIIYYFLSTSSSGI